MLNVNTWGPREIDENNQILTLTKHTLGWLTVKRPNGLWESKIYSHLISDKSALTVYARSEKYIKSNFLSQE